MLLKYKQAHSFNRYEKKFLKAEDLSESVKSLLVGSARSLRLSRSYDNTDKQIIWETSVNILAPMYLLYTKWVLEKARKENIKRLYFVARDGYLYYKIALQIQSVFNEYGIELKYLYGSRQAWYYPAIEDLSEFELSWILRVDLNFCSVKTIFARIQLNPKEFKSIIEAQGFPESIWNRNLTTIERISLGQCFFKHDIKKKILHKTHHAFQNTVGYFNQEGLFERIKYAIVDIGWSGRSQYALSRIIDKSGHRPEHGIRGFYFGLYRKRKIYKNDKIEAFIFDGSLSLMQSRISNIMLYEVFSASSDARTIGYTYETGKGFFPVFAQAKNDLGLKWGVQLQQEAVFAMTSNLVKNLSFLELTNMEYKKTLIRILAEFIDNPSKKEADVYGKYMINAEPMGNDLREIAPQVNIRFLIKKIIRGERPISFWPIGSLNRSELLVLPFIWKILKLYFWVKGRLEARIETLNYRSR